MSYNKETGMYEGYIYAVIFKPTKIVKYIGQTRTTVISRWKHHCRDMNKFDYALYRGLNKYGIDSFIVVEIEKIEEYSIKKLSKKMDNREIYWVDYYDTFIDGYNETIGGQNNAPNRFPDRPVCEYNLQGIKLAEYPSLSAASDATNYSRGDINSCCLKTKVHRVGNSIFRYAEDILTENEIEWYLKKYPKIMQYDLDGNLLNTFNFISDAVKYLSKENIQIKVGNISMCCNGKYLSVGGFVWRKYPDNFNSYKTPKVSKLIEQRDRTTGKLINTYNSFNEIKNKFNFNNTLSINNCCNNRIHVAHGYHWCYQGEFDFLNLQGQRCKQVEQYNKNNELLNVFDSISEAIDYLKIKSNVATSTISEVCMGKKKSAYGFVWKYTYDKILESLV